MPWSKNFWASGLVVAIGWRCEPVPVRSVAGVFGGDIPGISACWASRMAGRWSAERSARARILIFMGILQEPVKDSSLRRSTIRRPGRCVMALAIANRSRSSSPGSSRRPSPSPRRPRRARDLPRPPRSPPSPGPSVSPPSRGSPSTASRTACACCSSPIRRSRRSRSTSPISWARATRTTARRAWRTCSSTCSSRARRSIPSSTRSSWRTARSRTPRPGTTARTTTRRSRPPTRT